MVGSTLKPAYQRTIIHKNTRTQRSHCPPKTACAFLKSNTVNAYFSGLLLKLVSAASDDNLHSVSFTINWGYDLGENASVSCIEQSFIHIVNAYGYKIYTYSENVTYELTDSELSNLRTKCNCVNECFIPDVEEYRTNTWTLVIEYKCKGKN